MAFEIVDFNSEHGAQAAALAAERCRVLQQTVPELPRRYTEPSTFLPMIQELAARVPGVAAVRHGQVIGYLLGFVLTQFKGQRGVYSPEWANGARLDEAAVIYPALYARLAPRWLANGGYLHAMTLVASDRAGLDSLYWQNFGLHGVDAMRSLDAIDTPHVAGVEIRKATLDDLDDVQLLGDGLRRHLAEPPIFLALAQRESRAEHAEWLAAPDHIKWMAYLGGQPVAEIGFERSSLDACTIMRDEGTASITSAFTRIDVRGQGLAAALLERGLAEARRAGYVRCSVDFEAANIEGARFWMRYFQPICYSVTRVVDPRIGWAHARRAGQDFW